MKFYRFVWDTSETIYRLTGIDVLWPARLLSPGFGPWLFGKMIGVKGVKIEDRSP